MVASTAGVSSRVRGASPRLIATPPSPTPAMTVIQTASGARPDAELVRTGTIREGDLLNHIFEVKRLVARGGMGEVYEGVNVNSDERVAIKVILPALAAWERKEPRVSLFTIARRPTRTRAVCVAWPSPTISSTPKPSSTMLTSALARPTISLRSPATAYTPGTSRLMTN